MRYKPLIFSSLLLFVSCWAGGCNSSSKLEGLVPASGVILFENAPVEGARVTFAPQAGTGKQRIATATTDEKGRFSMMTLNPGDGVFPGEYAVSVTKTELMGEPKQETMPDGTVVERGRTDDRVRDMLPAKYKEAKSSGLTITIPESKGNKNIEFVLEGEVDDTPKLPSGPGKRR